MSDDRNEGVSPLFAPVLEALLDVPLQIVVQHAAVRGKRVARCGAYGQTAFTPSAVTCAACKRATKPRLSRAEAAKVRSLVVDEGETRASAEAWVRAFGVGS